MSPDSERRAVVFDLDGVLVDSSEFHLRAFERLGESLGVEATEEFHRATFGMRADETIRALLPNVTDDELPALIDRKEAAYRDIARGNLEPLPGAVELVRALESDGFALAIGSSTVRANIALVLEELGVADAFDVIVSGEDVTRGKPAPDVFLIAAEKLSLPPAHCVVIEDSVHGVEAAVAANMSVVAVTSSQPRGKLTDATLIVDSLLELTPNRVCECIG